MPYNEWESWKKTKHAHAYHTLEVAGHETDPECLTCHTVGFGVSSGFISVGKTPNHVDVGCENCHGAGSTHAENPEQKGYGLVKEKLCITCHTTENSSKFDIEVYFAKLCIHPRSHLLWRNDHEKVFIFMQFSLCLRCAHGFYHFWKRG